MRIFKNAWFERFARKENISAKALWTAVKRAEQGLIDADLGGGVIKQRIPRQGGGKSSGYRSIILYRKASKAFFVFGFAKNDQDNIRKDEVEAFKRMAQHVLEITDEQLLKLVALGQFEEVKKDD